MLHEEKIVMHCDHLSVMTTVAEGLRILLHPLDYGFVFIPVLPGYVCLSSVTIYCLHHINERVYCVFEWCSSGL